MQLFFSMKRDHRNVVGTGKNMWGLYVRFLCMIINQKATSKKLCQICLKHTTNQNNEFGSIVMKISNLV